MKLSIINVVILSLLSHSVKVASYNTGCNSNGGNEYFDRHNVKCPSGMAMTGWRGNSCFRIDFNCVTLPRNAGITYQYTPCNEFKGRGLNYWDRHNVACPSQYVMKEWKLNNDCGGNRNRFRSTCAKLQSVNPGQNICYTTYAGCNDVNNRELKYLDRHYLQCNTGSFLSGFVLTGYGCSGSNKRFRYTCCREPNPPPPTKTPTAPPTAPPTNLPSTSPTAGAQGDPHFITWSNNKFDFHGVCDLLMLSNENFENSVGMEIHIRTKKMHMWSYISVLAIRIGDSILEVIGEDGGSYIMNGIVHQGKDDGLMMLSGYPIIYSKKNKKQQTFRLNLDNLEAIVIKTWNSFVSVHFENPKRKHFEDSAGLMGSFPDGVLLARDNLTIIDDANKFGQEWQVMETEKTLFHQVQGPQQPLEKCEIPSNLEMRRILGEKTITEEKAKAACIGVEANSIDLCIFDVMATCNLSTAGAY